ncbi:MAG TPA: integrin alpha, partial [Anaerolineales bacterium]|nr:integrin alpha [Anaerolineales bacterium]
WSVGSAGDVNGDGYDDVIIGAPWASYPEGHEGRAYVFYGSSTGLPDTANWTQESNTWWTGFGSWTDSAGDVNGDGYDDVIVGHYGWSSPEDHEGRAYVYLGSDTGILLSPAWTFENNHANSELGISVAGVGDVNGDSYDDVMVGGGRYANPEPFEGISYLFLGSATGLSLDPDWSQEGNQNWAQYGWAIEPAGDVNADGYDDAIIGSPWYTDTVHTEGVAFLYFGSASGSVFTTSYSKGAGQVDAKWGWSLSSAGDVNGDGRDDIIVGARDYDGGQDNEGRATLFYGMPDIVSQNFLPVTVR